MVSGGLLWAAVRIGRDGLKAGHSLLGFGCSLVFVTSPFVVFNAHLMGYLDHFVVLATLAGVVLAADEGALPRILMPFRLFAGGRVGSGRQWFPWIHLRDEVRALRFLIERESMRGAFNVCAPIPVTNAQLASAIAAVLRRPALMPTPALALRLLLGEMATLVLDGQRAVPTRLMDAGFEFEFAELEEALRELVGGEKRS